jgi:hypothetical protein
MKKNNIAVVKQFPETEHSSAQKKKQETTMIPE